MYYESLYRRDGKDLFEHLLRKHPVERFNRLVLNQPLTRLDRIGKNLVFRYADTAGVLQMHLNSTGWWVPANDLARQAAPQNHLQDSFIKSAVAKSGLRHTMVAFTYDDGQVWAYIDPRTWGRFYPWHKHELEAKQECDLLLYGPDWLREPGVATKKLLSWHRDSSRKVKQVLLDQRITAGIGNWIYNEACYHARIHPLELWANLSDQRIKDLAVIINALIHTGVNSSTYWYWQIFGKKGPSPRDPRETITYVKDYPNSVRGNYFCPSSQRLLHGSQDPYRDGPSLFSGARRSATLLGVPRLPHAPTIPVLLLPENDDRSLDTYSTRESQPTLQGVRVGTTSSASA